MWQMQKKRVPWIQRSNVLEQIEDFFNWDYVPPSNQKGDSHVSEGLFVDPGFRPDLPPDISPVPLDDSITENTRLNVDGKRGRDQEDLAQPTEKRRTLVQADPKLELAQSNENALPYTPKNDKL